MSSLYLFTGENSFELHAEAQRWKQGFREKHGDENLHTLDGKKLKWNELLDEAAAAPFIAEKRLIIIESVPRIEKEQLQELVEHMHPSSLVVFVDPKPDARLGAVKLLKKIADVKVFENKSVGQLVSWIQEWSQQHGHSLTKECAQALVHKVGNDQWHLMQEARKLITYTGDRAVTTKDIDMVCIPTAEQTIWKVSDFIGRKDSNGAILYTHQLWQRGEDAYSLWNIALWIMRSLIVVWMWHHEEHAAPNVIAKEGGVPFPTVRSLLPCAQALSKQQIQTISECVTQAEIALKTGKIRTTSQEGIELMTLLERQLQRIHT